MNIYKLSRPPENEASPDHYEGAVVYAPCEDEAQGLHPNGDTWPRFFQGVDSSFFEKWTAGWVLPGDVVVTLLAEDVPHNELGVILVSIKA